MIETKRICISSPPDRSHLVAEIFLDQLQWVEINYEHDIFEIEFYSRPDNQPWCIDFTLAIDLLIEAKFELMKKAGISE